MKKIKRLMIVCLALAMVASLAACSKSTPATTTAPATTAAAVEIDTEGKTAVEGTIHYSDGSFAACNIYYDKDGWVAQIVNEASGINDVAEGTFEGTVLVGDYKDLNLLQDLFNEKTVKSSKDNVDFGMFQSDVTFNYNDVLWDASFISGLDNTDIALSGIIENGILTVIKDSTDGFGQALTDGGIQAYYTSLAGKTVTGMATLMTGPTEVTMWYNNDNWTVDLFIKDANENVHLEGTIKDGKLELVEDSSGGFGSAMMDGLQAFYEDCLAGTVTTEASGDAAPADAGNVVEVTLPSMAGMKFYGEQIDMGGMDTPDVILGYNDDKWVITYYFNPVQITVCMHGTIDNGKLVVVESSNPYVGDEETMAMLQVVYDDALKNEPMKMVSGEVDFNGMATYPIELHFSDKYWAVTYCFEMANKNVIVSGTIDNGKLVVVNDPSGAGKDMIDAYQALYDANK